MRRHCVCHQSFVDDFVDTDNGIHAKTIVRVLNYCEKPHLLLKQCSIRAKFIHRDEEIYIVMFKS